MQNVPKRNKNTTCLVENHVYKEFEQINNKDQENTFYHSNILGGRRSNKNHNNSSSVKGKAMNINFNNCPIDGAPRGRFCAAEEKATALKNWFTNWFSSSHVPALVKGGRAGTGRSFSLTDLT
jgi:hypothetical protein